MPDKKKAPQLPPAQAMWCFQRKHPNGKPAGLLVSDKFQYVVHGGPCVPCLALPMSSPEQAKARLKWEKLSDEQKVREVSILIYRKFHGRKPHSKYEMGYEEFARAILALIQGASHEP